MEYIWEDLPKPLNCFTTQNTAMINLNTRKVVQHYSTNTKIVVVQKCVTPEGTYYRTSSAEHHYLNYAFKAEALGLPNEKAPSVPPSKVNTLKTRTNNTPVFRTLSIKKIKSDPKPSSPDDGEEKVFKKMVAKIFRRKNG